jgi:hypothetical protein
MLSFIKLLQGCHSNHVNKVVELQEDTKLLEQLVTSLQLSQQPIIASCQQPVKNLSTNWEQSARTHLDNKVLNSFGTRLLHIFYKLFVFSHLCTELGLEA